MTLKLFEVKEQISGGKSIRLCFHVQRFSVNCFCVSLNSFSRNVQWCHEFFTDEIDSNCIT